MSRSICWRISCRSATHAAAGASALPLSWAGMLPLCVCRFTKALASLCGSIDLWMLCMARIAPEAAAGTSSVTADLVGGVHTLDCHKLPELHVVTLVHLQQEQNKQGVA